MPHAKLIPIALAVWISAAAAAHADDKDGEQTEKPRHRA